MICMCGIAGWVDLEQDLMEKKHIVEAMSQTLSPRGPDASGIWTSPHALIAHRRLIVVDPAGGGQPMVRQRDGFSFVITYNGELYNTNDLREELISKGHVFQSRSDTEVLLVSYMEWGTDCVEHLNGIYAFGIWDEKKQSLFLARDRFGVKPLFYTQVGSSLIFGSELKTLLAHPLVKPKIDSEGLGEIFALAPARTPGHGVFKNVFEVKPAHCLLYGEYGIRKWRYWQLESRPHEDGMDVTLEKLTVLVKDAVLRQLVADVPVCTFLSGGLDSSAITALAAENFKAANLGQLHTYSIDYVDNDKYFKASLFQPNSDAPWVKRMVQECGTYHHYIEFDTPQLADALTSAVDARDLPGMTDIDSSLWLFCREVKKNATVALSGECADEVFGGYPWFHKKELLESNTFPWSVNLSERTRILSDSLKEAIRPEQYVEQRYIETIEEVPELAGENETEARRRRIFYLNLTWFMTTLLDRKDRMSMAHGLEVRVPYCDHRLVQYVWNIPWEMKMYNNREKGLLRQALTGVLPEDVLWRKKSPYPKTHNPSYENAVKAMALEIVYDPNSPIHPFIDKTEVTSLIKESSDYGKPWFGQLMARPQLFAYLIQLDYWMRKYKVTVV